MLVRAKEDRSWHIYKKPARDKLSFSEQASDYNFNKKTWQSWKKILTIV